MRETVIHESANRPNQILGGDRELVIGSGMVAVLILFSLGNIVGIVIGILFWLSSVFVLQRMGKADPLLRRVYLRHIRYQPFYPAKATLHSRAVPMPAKWR
jgi:type IV secretion system protein VirB3